MKAQFKYAIRSGLGLRAAALLGTLVINAVFAAAGLTGLVSENVMILGVVLSSLSLCAVFAINIISDALGFRNIYDAPHGYLFAMTPVKHWKILLPRIVSYAVMDAISLAIAITGVVLQSNILDGSLTGGAVTRITMQSFSADIFLFGMGLLGYAYIMLLVVFSQALKSTVFYHMRGRGVLAGLCVLAVAWAFNLTGFLFMPIGMFQGWSWIFYSITLNVNNPLHVAAYYIVSLAKISALFAASSALAERRINL